MQNMITVKVDCTSLNCATKRLKVQQTKKGKKLVISSNLLPLFGFEKGEEVVEESLGENKGFIIRKANKNDSKVKKVYSRTYKSRRNNPFETLLDVRSQKILDESLSSEEVLITFNHGKIKVAPVTDAVESLENLKNNPYGLMGVCTSGIDVHASESVGFQCQTLLEYRPHEKRDKRDLTETGLVNAMTNTGSELSVVFNEDVYKVDPMVVKEKMLKNPAVFIVSLQCDDFSNTKAKSLKEKSIDELSTTRDMFIPVATLIKTILPPVVVLENVPQFEKSYEKELWDIQLRRLGYKIHDFTLSGEDFGYTKRKRFFQVATLIPEAFDIPTPIKLKESLWIDLILPKLERGDLRCVSSSKSIQDGKKCGRLRIINKSSEKAPTLLKSQSRMAKDSVVIEHKGEFYWPDEELERLFMSYSPDLCLDGVSKSLASEIIGQGVEYMLYQEIMKEVRIHIEKFLD